MHFWSLEKSLEPKKDAEGKVIELPEQERKKAEAELQAITEIQKESTVGSFLIWNLFNLENRQ